MPRELTASDRSALLRLASLLPVGSPERRKIIAMVGVPDAMIIAQIEAGLDPDVRVTDLPRIVAQAPQSGRTDIFQALVNAGKGKGLDESEAESVALAAVYPGMEMYGRPLVKGGMTLPFRYGRFALENWPDDRRDEFAGSLADGGHAVAGRMYKAMERLLRNYVRLKQDQGEEITESVQEHVSVDEAQEAFTDPSALEAVALKSGLSNVEKAYVDAVIEAARDSKWEQITGKPSVFRASSGGKGKELEDEMDGLAVASIEGAALRRYLVSKNPELEAQLPLAANIIRAWKRAVEKMIPAAREYILENDSARIPRGPGADIRDRDIRETYRSDLRGRRAALERRAMIRLAATLPVGSPERRAILAGCEKLPAGPMRDNCEKKKEEGASDKKAGTKTAGSGARNKAYLDSLNARQQLTILAAAAKTYGVGIEEIREELIHPDAEALYEYLAPNRSMAMKVLRDFQSGRYASSVREAGKGKVPDALKKHQFTKDDPDNPNPKGNDKDGDGKTNEKKPFKSAAYRPEVGEMVMVGTLRGKVERVRNKDAWVETDHGGSWVPLTNISRMGKKAALVRLAAALPKGSDERREILRMATAL